MTLQTTNAFDVATPLQVTAYNSAVASSPVELGGENGKIDFLARLQQDDNSDLYISSVVRTEDVFLKMTKVLFENTILRKAVKNLWKTVQYNNEYALFLLGQYDNEQFVKIAKKYATRPTADIDKGELVDSAGVIFSVIDSELSSRDLSTILDIDCSLIEATLSELPDHE